MSVRNEGRGGLVGKRTNYTPHNNVQWLESFSCNRDPGREREKKKRECLHYCCGMWVFKCRPVNHFSDVPCKKKKKEKRHTFAHATSDIIKTIKKNFAMTKITQFKSLNSAIVRLKLYNTIDKNDATAYLQ